MVFGVTGAAAPGPPSFALGPAFGVCPGRMAKTTAAATAAAASAATPIAPARLLNRPRLPLPAPETADGGPSRVPPGEPAPGEPAPGGPVPGGPVPGGPVPGGPVPRGPGSRSSEPFDRTAPPADTGLPGCGPACCPACCQVRARMVWVGE